MVEEFLMLHTIACNLKLWIVYFWNFPFHIFGLQVTETMEKETTAEVRPLLRDQPRSLY
jgi:hypothetical protein